VLSYGLQGMMIAEPAYPDTESLLDRRSMRNNFVAACLALCAGACIRAADRLHVGRRSDGRGRAFSAFTRKRHSSRNRMRASRPRIRAPTAYVRSAKRRIRSAPRCFWGRSYGPGASSTSIPRSSRDADFPMCSASPASRTATSRASAKARGGFYHARLFLRQTFDFGESARSGRSGREPAAHALRGRHGSC